MFTDKVTIRLLAGKGGNGCVAWRREKYIPKGGPTGGNGGLGGSIVIRADESVFSLEKLRYRRLLKAEKGADGGPNRRQGKRGENLMIKVPCGTLIKTDETVYDLTDHGQELIICQGGRGGRGNASFATPTRQAPNFAIPGTPGEEKIVEMELKLIADVGLVGLPNAGKSTFMNAVTQVEVKIAAYPFTTLRPNLGYVGDILLADIPGIIKGAHRNRGLGFEFLRHIERTKILVYILDASQTPLEDYEVLREELGTYDPELLSRPSFIFLNKCDEVEEVDFPHPHFKISALERQGLSEAVAALHRKQNEITCAGNKSDGCPSWPVDEIAQ